MKLRVLSVMSLGALFSLGCAGEPSETEVARIGNSVVQLCSSRDAGLLHSLKPADGGGRICLYDDECPLGAFCNQSTNLCDWHCIPGEAAYECGGDGDGGVACDCSGRCTESNDLENRLVLPTMAASPGHLVFGRADGGASWLPQEVKVVLQIASATGVPMWLESGGASVNVEGGAGMQVACALEDAGFSSYSSECNLHFTAEEFDKVGDTYAATQAARLLPLAQTDGGLWNANLFSLDTSPPRILLTGESLDSAGGTNVSEHWGHLLLRTESARSEADGGTATPVVRLPIRAWGNADFLLLYDATRTISPSGKILLDADAGSSNYPVQWLAGGSGQGALRVQIEADAVPNPVLTSSISGSFRIGLPQPVAGAPGEISHLAAEYKLSRIRGRNPEPCASGRCSSGFSCEKALGVCVPGSPWTATPSGSAENTIVSAFRTTWDDQQARDMLLAALTSYSESASGSPLPPWRLGEAIACSQGDESTAPGGFVPFRFSPSITPADEDNILEKSGDLNCTNGKPPYVADFFTQWDRYDDGLGTINRQRLKTADLLAECIADLGRVPGLERADSAAHWITDRLGHVYPTQRLVAPISNEPDPLTPGRCFSLARFFGALSASSIQANSRDQRFAARLLQQWIGVNGFIAHQVAQEREAAEFLGEDLSSRPEINRLDLALGRFESAWDVLLDGAYRGLLPGNDATRTCVHLNPDYRRAHLPVASWKVVPSPAHSERTRGMGMRWRAGESTIVFTPSAASYACSASATTPLFEIDYGPTAIAEEARTFAGECSGSNLKTSIYATAPSGGTSWWWWNGTFASVGLLTSASGNSSYVRNGSSLAAPVLPNQTLPFTHFLLRPSGGYVGGPSGSTLAAWDYVLEDSVLTSAMSIPTAINPSIADGSAAADYSHVFEGKQNDPAVGLPAIVLEGLTAHVRLLLAQLERAEGEVIAQCGPPAPGSAREKLEALFGRTMRYVTVLEAFAVASRERDLEACGADSELAWDGRWRSAVAELAVIRQRAYDKLRQITDCAPFGLALNQAPIFPVDQDFTNNVARFFSNSTRLHEIASNQLMRAMSDAQAAEQAWISARQSEVRELESVNVQRQRITELKRQYGSQVIQLCGLGPEYSSETVLDEFGKNGLSVSNCHLKPECRADGAELAAHVESDPKVQLKRLRYTFCTWDKMSKISGISLPPEAKPAYVARYDDPGLTIDTALVETTPSGTAVLLPLHLPGLPDEVIDLALLYGLPFPEGELPPAALAEAHEQCTAEGGGQWLFTTPEVKDTCYTGQIGEAHVALQVAVKNVEAAHSAWGDVQRRFDVAVRGCHELEADQDAKVALSAEHRAKMEELNRTKAAEERKANQARTAARTVDNSVNIGVGVAMAATGADLVGGIVTAVTGATALILDNVASDHENKAMAAAANMQNEETAYQDQINQLEAQSAIKQCYIAAQQYLVGARTEALHADGAMLEAQRALTSFESMQTRVAQLVAEGREVVLRESGSPIPGFSHHFWLSEKIDAARQSFERAKRFAYLFGRALEYEKQQSNVALGEILSARGPYALDLAFSRYAYSAVNKTVWGNAPEGAPFALRLRDDILKLGNSAQGTGERNLTPAQQFTQRMLSSAGALYDDSGKYLGQGFRFSLPDVPNTNQCAERVWDVHVRLSGGSRLKAWTEMHGRPALRLRQRNTFSSRLCTDTTQWQTAYVRPSWTAEDWPKPGDEMAFSETVVKAGAGTSFLDFETQGDGPFGATKLRGRGLFSEYEIVFPWDGLLSQNNQPTDFPLNDVIDVWVRFEPAYVVPAR